MRWSAPVGSYYLLLLLTLLVLLILGFATCLFLMYSLTPHMMVLSNATLLNLSLLTSDVFAVLAGVFMFGSTVRVQNCTCYDDSQPSLLYFIAFLIIISGIVLYNVDLKPSAINNKYTTLPEEGDEGDEKGTPKQRQEQEQQPLSP